MTYMVVVYEMEPGIPLSNSQVVSWVLLDTRPEFSDLGSAKSFPHLPLKLSSHVRVDNSQLE